MEHRNHFGLYNTGHDGPPAAPWWKTTSGLVMCGFLLVAGFYLFTEHRAHLWGVLPLLFILACPLMHFFHHHGHHAHSAGPPPAGPEPDKSKAENI